MYTQNKLADCQRQCCNEKLRRGEGTDVPEENRETLWSHPWEQHRKNQLIASVESFLKDWLL
jgi:hypothetical protein